MAIDHRIIRSIGVRDNAPALNMFQNALTSTQNRRVQAAQEERRAEIAPFQLQQAQQNLDVNQQAINQERQKQRLVNIHQTGQRLKPFLESGDTQGAQQFLLDNISQIQSRIEQGSGEDVTESMDALAKLQAGDTQGLLGDINAVSGLVLGNKGMSVNQREFNSNVAAVKSDPNLETVEGKAAAIKLGLEAKASSAAQIQIAKDPELTKAVAESEAAIAGAKAGATEGEKLKQQRKHKPAIAASVKLAEKEAIERGEVLTDLSRMEATLPGLLEVTTELKDLARVATSTLGGKAFDAIVKQSGFGATKGSTARAKFIAIIDNQVLPLLRPTFGGSFTVTEGDSLRATLGDPDATLDAKVAQIDAFIAQKERDIRSKQSQLNQEQTATAPTIIRFDAQGNQI